jgi:protein-S-isoprenylcysteine O-methyltransferase Ste14
MTAFPPQDDHNNVEPLHPSEGAMPDSIHRLNAVIAELEARLARIPHELVRGPRGQLLRRWRARERAEEQSARIDLDDDRGSRRHRLVRLPIKIITFMLLIFVDYPVMLFVTGSVFDVNWSDPWGMPLAISIVISLLATAGAAWTLHHIGHSLRDDKTHDGRLVWRRLSRGARASLVGAVVLVLLIGIVMFLRVYTEGVLSGMSDLAVLLALLIAVVMTLSAWLVFAAAFRDGSPELDDLEHYTRLALESHDREEVIQAEIDRTRATRDALAARQGPSDPPIDPPSGGLRSA